MNLREEIARTNFDYDKSLGLHRKRETYEYNDITKEYYLTLADKYIQLIEKRIDQRIQYFKDNGNLDHIVKITELENLKELLNQ